MSCQIQTKRTWIRTESYPVELKFAAQAEPIGTLGRIMKTFAVKVSNFKKRSLTIEMYASIHCSNWSVHLDIRAACYLLVFKLREKPHVAWNNYRHEKSGKLSLKLGHGDRQMPTLTSCLEDPQIKKFADLV